jgi:hypothetical protein
MHTNGKERPYRVTFAPNSHARARRELPKQSGRVLLTPMKRLMDADTALFVKYRYYLQSCGQEDPSVYEIRCRGCCVKSNPGFDCVEVGVTERHPTERLLDSKSGLRMRYVQIQGKSIKGVTKIAHSLGLLED